MMINPPANDKTREFAERKYFLSFSLGMKGSGTFSQSMASVRTEIMQHGNQQVVAEKEKTSTFRVPSCTCFISQVSRVGCLDCESVTHNRSKIKVIYVESVIVPVGTSAPGSVPCFKIKTFRYRHYCCFLSGTQNYRTRYTALKTEQ